MAKDFLKPLDASPGDWVVYLRDARRPVILRPHYQEIDLSEGPLGGLVYSSSGTPTQTAPKPRFTLVGNEIRKPRRALMRNHIIGGPLYIEPLAFNNNEESRNGEGDAQGSVEGSVWLNVEIWDGDQSNFEPATSRSRWRGIYADFTIC